ncbi:hypothetical protein BDZ91DRAFT_711439 [Kalaharituber pfeilii]|nr:hypothetical protein BDZ91DRAFT_711439 [Kalaharituber pfeilii]
MPAVPASSAAFLRSVTSLPPCTPSAWPWPWPCNRFQPPSQLLASIAAAHSLDSDLPLEAF